MHDTRDLIIQTDLSFLIGCLLLVLLFPLLLLFGLFLELQLQHARSSQLDVAQQSIYYLLLREGFY